MSRNSMKIIEKSATAYSDRQSYQYALFNSGYLNFILYCDRG